MTTYILENNPETVKWLLGRNFDQTLDHRTNTDSIVVWNNIKVFMLSRRKELSIPVIPITLKKLQELEVLKALGITYV